MIIDIFKKFLYFFLQITTKMNDLIKYKNEYYINIKKIIKRIILTLIGVYVWVYYMYNQKNVDEMIIYKIIFSTLYNISIIYILSYFISR